MMLKYIFLICSLFLVFAHAETSISISFSKVCQKDLCYDASNGKDLFKTNVKFESELPATYVSDDFYLNNINCYADNNCFLYLGSVNDSFNLVLNGHSILNLISGGQNYLSYKSTYVPLPKEFLNLIEPNSIRVEVKDLNKIQWGLLNKNIILGSYSYINKIQGVDWLARTGITMFSAYFLFIFSFLMLIVYLVIRQKNTLYILVYCLVSFLYLISFTEIPRDFFNPEKMSGIVHFPLRIMQDFVLFVLLNKILNKSNSLKYFYKTIYSLYLLTLTSFLFCYLSGYTNFIVVKRIMLFAAFLVAMPLGFGFLLIYRLGKSLERDILLPIFFILFIFQVNDLLVFWQLIQSVYTVKFYIPYVVILLVFTEVRNYASDYALKNILAEKVQNAKQIVHDIRSPLSVLNILSDRIQTGGEEHKLFVGAIQSIELISRNLMEQTSVSSSISKFNALTILDTVISSKRIEYPNISFSLQAKNVNNFYIAGNALDFSRIVSNLINNSVESYEGKSNAEVHVNVSQKNKSILIEVIDFGKGVPKNIIYKLGRFGFSYGKEDLKNANSGSGLGLYSAIKTVELWGGSLNIKSKESEGTQVSLILPLL